MAYNSNVDLKKQQNHCSNCGDEAVHLYEAETDLFVCGTCFYGVDIETPQELNFDEEIIRI